MKYMLLSGYTIEYKDISICFLPNYGVHQRPKFQVHVSHRKLKDRVFSELYSSLDEAIDKFYGLKEYIYGQNKSNGSS